MFARREFLLLSAAAASAAPKMSSKERVNRALRGQEVDRTPFTFWYHFGLEKEPGDRHAEATLAFHRKFRTDLVKVMSDYPYPRSRGRWYELKVEPDPFPQQLRALARIRDGLDGRAHFVETIFNPWNVAEKLSSKEEVLRLKRENPRALLAALETIAKSEAAHARQAVAAGAAGVFLAIANAQDGILSREDYGKFSEPFDRMVLEAVPAAPLNILHLHGDKVYLDHFFQGWPAAAINYSAHDAGVGLAEARRRYSGLLIGGLDERDYRQLREPELKRQWEAARRAAGARLLLAPGCSVPNDTADAELLRLVRVVGA
jgi:uroporphyrinogen decarboxylase